MMHLAWLLNWSHEIQEELFLIALEKYVFTDTTLAANFHKRLVQNDW